MARRSGGRNRALSGETNPLEPAWAESINIQLLPSNRVNLAYSTQVSLSVFGLGEETLVDYIRTGTIPRDFNALEDGAYSSEEFDILAILSPKTTAPTLEVKIGVSRGGQRTYIRRSLVLSVTGVLRVTNEGIEVVNPQDPMSCADARGYAYRILPPSSDRRDLALMESSVFLRRLWTNPRPLESVGGYGAALRIRAPYNWVFDHDLLTVSSEIQDHGIIEAAISDNSGRLRLWLSQPLEPGSLHTVVFWTPGMPPVVVPADESVTHSDSSPHIWDVTYPEPFTSSETVFVAIAYSGTRIGAWWPADSSQSILVDSESSHETGVMLRWIHAPIVSPEWRDAVRDFAQHFPAQVLRSWLRDDDLPTGLKYGMEGQHWRSAVREIFSEWSPDFQTAAAVVRELRDAEAMTNEHAMLQAFWRLLRLDPVLMGRVARTFSRTRELPSVIRTMQHQLAELPPGSTSFDIAGREEDLLREVSTQVGRDPGFLDRGIVHRVLQGLDYSGLGTVDRNNAEVALNIAPFREYLGLKILSSLAN